MLITQLMQSYVKNKLYLHGIEKRIKPKFLLFCLLRLVLFFECVNVHYIINVGLLFGVK